jgi:hypothetical protein
MPIPHGSSGILRWTFDTAVMVKFQRVSESGAGRGRRHAARRAPATPRLSADDLDEPITRREIRVIGLSACLVSEDVVLELDDHDAPGIHYISSGNGRLHIAGTGTVRQETMCQNS